MVGKASLSAGAAVGRSVWSRTARLLAWVLGLILLLMAALMAALAMDAERPDKPVGLQRIVVENAGQRPLTVAIFYPSSDPPDWVWLGLKAGRINSDGPIVGSGLPIVVVSHGTGGSATGHYRTELALAQAGFVVVAPEHAGDNFRDESRVGTADWIPGRTRELALAVDFVTSKWAYRSHVDRRRLGLFGFSAGGTAVLAALGGRLDWSRVESHCAANLELVCKLLKPGSLQQAVPERAWARIPETRAAVISAPGFGFAFASPTDSPITAKVQLWGAAADQNAPVASNAERIRQTLPGETEYHLVAGAGHGSFMPSCGLFSPLLPPALCSDPAGFDRAAFLEQFDRSVVEFFSEELKGPAMPYPA